jgi:hypothetical protein
MAIIGFVAFEIGICLLAEKHQITYIMELKPTSARQQDRYLSLLFQMVGQIFEGRFQFLVIIFSADAILPRTKSWSSFVAAAE